MPYTLNRLWQSYYTCTRKQLESVEQIHCKQTVCDLNYGDKQFSSSPLPFKRNLLETTLGTTRERLHYSYFLYVKCPMHQLKQLMGSQFKFRQTWKTKNKCHSRNKMCTCTPYDRQCSSRSTCMCSVQKELLQHKLYIRGATRKADKTYHFSWHYSATVECLSTLQCGNIREWRMSSSRSKYLILSCDLLSELFSSFI